MRLGVEAEEAPPFGEDFRRFVEGGADRLVRLTGMLAQRGLSSRVIAIAGRRHILVKTRGRKALALLVAHYDRVEGSPGALDNSASCLILADVAQRVFAEQGRRDGGIFFLFTDGEEAPAAEGPLSQGAFLLGRGLRRVLGEDMPAILVLDVVGRGDQAIFSSASSDMLTRIGEGRGSLVPRLRDLESELVSAARVAKLRDPLRLSLPWSDDLGFVLAGLPAIELSLLPKDEAARYARGLSKLGQGDSLPSSAALGTAWPKTWSRLHSPLDSIDLIEEGAVEAMTALCLAYCRSLLARADVLASTSKKF